MKLNWKWSIGILLVTAVVVSLFFIEVPVHAQVPSVTLDWTAPGDDGAVGTATTYEMRWSATRPDTTNTAAMNAWWSVATPVSGLPVPLIAGTTQSVTVTPPGGFLSGRVYYFVIRCADEVPNWSGFSNVAVLSVPDTLAPRPIIDLRRR